MAGWASLLLLITRFLSWIHACVVAPLVHWWEESVLGIWEHVVTSVLRESFNEWTRIANGMSAWFLSLFQYNYRDKLRKAWKPGPSKAAEPSRPSTLNAILEALHRAESRPSSENEAVIPPPTCEGVRMDEIQSPCDTTGEALPFLSMQSSRFELKSSPGRLSTLMRRRPWPTHSTKQPSAPTHHSPPTKPSSGSHRLFSTPEEGAGLSEVAAAFMQPSGAGVIVRQRGLLEDARIWTELAVAQGFSAWRQSVRWIFRVPSHERALTPSPASTPRDLDLTTCDSLPTQPQATKDHIGCWDVTSNMDCAEDGRTKFNAAAASLFEAAAQCPSMRQSISTCASASASAASCSSDHPQDYEVGRVYGGDKVSLEDTEQQHPLIHSTVVPQLPQRPSLWSWLRHRGRPPQCHSNSLPPSQPRQEAGIVLEGRMGRCEGRMGRCEGRMGRCQRLLPRSQSMRDTRNKQPPLQVNVHSPTASSDTNSPSTPIVAPPAISPASPAVAQNSSSRPCYLPASSPPLRRVRSFSRSEGSVLCQHMSEVSNAADVVRLSGYPLEQHTVTTQDGYILVLDRIPRHNSKEVVFFMHGVMDSSMTWVSGGITGSQAFAAWEAGFDVWMGNTRSNAPRLHKDPTKMGAAYWRYNINHIGVYDVGAQLDHIHETKCSELLGIIDAAKFRRKSAQVHGQGKTAAGKGVNQPDHAAAVAAAVTAADVSPSLQGISRPVGQMITKGKAAWSSLNASPCVGDSEGKPSRSTPRWWMTRSLMPGDDNLEVMQPCTAHQPPSSTVAPADHLISLLGEDRSNDMPSCQEKCDSGMNPSSTDCRERAAGGIGGDSCCRPKLHQQHRGWWSSFRWRLPLPRLGQNGGRMTGPHPVDDAAEWGSNTGHVGAQEVPQSQEVEEIDGEERTFEHFHSAQSEDLSSTQALSEGDVLGIMSTPQKHEEQQLQACKALPTEMGSEHEEHTFVERLKQPVIAAEEPYRLRAVGHSLGGVNMLMHCIVRRNSAGYGSVKSSAGHETAVGVRAPSLSTSSTHVHRLILMSPAGFHVQMPPAALPIYWFLPPFVSFMRMLWPHFAMPVYIPTYYIRALVFKLFRDVSSIPAALELLRLGMKLALNNDASQWERALQMPHYNAKHMPSLSVYQVLHLIQMARSGRFQMFDYGNSSANWAAYGGPKPPDLAANYGSLVGLPVDLIAGLRDGIVPPENIRIHLQLMNEAGVEVSYKEFDFGHLDFTFAVKEDLNMYLMKLLLKKK